MMEIKIAILLDACGIAYTRNQLSKLEALIKTFIHTQISKYIKRIDTDFNDSISDPIAIQKEENVFDDNEETKKQIKTEETVFTEDIYKYEKNVFVSEDSISHDFLEKSATDLKSEVEVNGFEAIPDLNLKEEITSDVNEDNSLVCFVCKLTFESKILINLHLRMTHNCELSFDQRKNFKWSCPCCSRKFSDTMISKLLFELRCLCGFRPSVRPSVCPKKNFLIVAHIKKCQYKKLSHF